MDRKLTTEFAEQVRLPLNPLSRHAIVAGMLENPEMVGEGVVVTANSAGFRTEGEPIHVHVDMVLPLLGRRALKKVAQSLEYVDRLGD